MSNDIVWYKETRHLITKLVKTAAVVKKLFNIISEVQ